LPVIMHITATTLEHVRKCASRIEAEDSVDAIELGLSDEADWQESEQLVAAAVKNTEKPVLVRLPFQSALELSQAAAESGAAALVACAPPRGTGRDAFSGKLVSGRIYGPLLKPIT